MSLRRFWNCKYGQLLDLIYPPMCHQCQAVLEDGKCLCTDCDSRFVRIESGFCKVCSEPFEGNFSELPTCPNCQHLEYSFDFAKSALQNTALSRQLVLDFKYRKQRYLAGTLAEFCAEVLDGDLRFLDLEEPILVPVPLHWRRKIQRGFNQAELISEHLSKLTNISSVNLLKRCRYTTTQTRLSRSQRLKNLKGAFKMSSKKAVFRSVILIDDVFTTGSTSEECAAVIKKEYPNVENIVVVTVLRG